MNENEKIVVSIAMTFLLSLILFLLCGVSFIESVIIPNTIEKEQKKAIMTGYGYWDVDIKTGDKKFVYGKRKN